MAKNTNQRLRSSLIYCVYPRAHSATGNFKGVQADLGRIARLGADILWLLPIHPIGKVQRKGSLGSPYAIQDYRAVNPEYGTLEDFRALLDEAHAQGLRCIIDVVYNHTSPDSVLAAEHPEWFYQTPEGEFGNRAGAWSDVIDLDYSHRDLWEYQIQTLEYWAEMGVDGFRCDVASPVPLAFWQAARERVELVRPGAVWLAESVHPAFISDMHAKGFGCHSDAELYGAFDITYDYDIHDLYAGRFTGQNTTDAWVDAICAQETAYPEGFLKLRFLENHDQARMAALLPDKKRMNMWTAFALFVRGTALLYAGQEARNRKTPSLFEREGVDWRGLDKDYCSLVRSLADLRRKPVFWQGEYTLQRGAVPGVAVACYKNGNERLYGVFNLDGAEGRQALPLPDGYYRNLAAGGLVQVQGGSVALGDVPLVLYQAD